MGAAVGSVAHVGTELVGDGFSLEEVVRDVFDLLGRTVVGVEVERERSAEAGVTVEEHRSGACGDLVGEVALRALGVVDSAAALTASKAHPAPLTCEKRCEG